MSRARQIEDAAAKFWIELNPEVFDELEPIELSDTPAIARGIATAKKYEGETHMRRMARRVGPRVYRVWKGAIRRDQ